MWSNWEFPGWQLPCWAGPGCCAVFLSLFAWDTCSTALINLATLFPTTFIFSSWARRGGESRNVSRVSGVTPAVLNRGRIPAWLYGRPHWPSWKLIRPHSISKNQFGPVIRERDQELTTRSFTNYLDYFRQILKGSNQTISYRYSTSELQIPPTFWSREKSPWLRV